nr:uncharacterized protein LOC114826492 [Malus domestica]
MTLILRRVDVNSTPVKVEEYFLQYLNVNNTSGQGLFEELQNLLKAFDLDIDDVRGQGYDNGSNMKGRHQDSERKYKMNDSQIIVGHTMGKPCLLAAINEVSKDLQSKDICINVAIEQVQGLIAYFEKYRETGFAEDMINAKKLAIEMEIDSVFPEKRQVRRKRHFDEKRLNSMDNDKLKDCCDRLQNFLKKCEFFDVDGDALFVELKLLQEPLPKEMKTSIDILNYLKRMRDCKHCVQNLVTERLNGLALISIESGFLHKIDYEGLIDDFAAKNARRSIFK